MPKLDRSTLEMALVGYAEQRRQIEAAIAAIQSQLGGRSTGAAASATADGAKPKRRLSAAARRRIGAAQVKRWAAHNKAKAEKAGPVKKATRKRLSPARRAALAANLVKARAARAAKRSAGEAVPF